MTKIKNFRITLRPRDVARWLKANRGLATTPELEASIDAAIKSVKPTLKTAAIYTTLTRVTGEKVTPLAYPSKSVAASIIAVTVGPELETARSAAETNGDTGQESLFAALQQEGLAQAIHFAIRLIQEQAKEEDCEMSPAIPSDDGTVLKPLAELLGLQRVGIDFNPDAPTLPAHARIVWTFWTPLGKGGKRETPSRSEKAAV